MSIEAGKKVIIKYDCNEDPRVRGAYGTVFAYATSNATVWITLEQPVGDLRSVRVRIENIAGAPIPNPCRNLNRSRGVFTTREARKIR